MTPFRPDLRDRILAQTSASPAPSRSAHRPLALRIAAGALVSSATAGGVLAVALCASLAPMAPRPIALVALTTGGAVVLAIVAASAGLFRRSTLGPSRPTLLAIAIAVPFSLFLWKIACSSFFPNAQHAIADRPGLRCLALSLAVGAAPLIAALFLRRNTDARHPATAGLALGVAIGAASWVAVDLWCPVGNATHLLLGHLLPIALLAAAGALAGPRWLAMPGGVDPARTAW